MNNVAAQLVDYAAARRAIREVRDAVFVREQRVPQALEFDGRDGEAKHALVRIGGKAVATGRIFPDGHLGRVAVRKPYRRRGLGRLVMAILLDAARAWRLPEVVISSQRRAAGFYRKLGFVAHGRPYQEAGIPHVAMTLPPAGRQRPKTNSTRRTTMRIAVFATGGTFDKEYNELNGELFFKQTHLPEMLKLGRSRVQVRIRTLMMKDSLFMTGADRRAIAAACRRAPEERIVVTHGTDTMPETARLLARQVPGKTVVLTGAMVPYKFGSSDGLFNLGSALAFAQVLPHGVYVAMNGRVFPADQVTKNRKIGVFEEKRSRK